MSARTAVALAVAVAIALYLAVPCWPTPRCPETCAEFRREPSVLLFGHNSVGGYFALPTTIVTCARYVESCPPDGGARTKDDDAHSWGGGR